jgi:hypothetical protein
MQLTTKEKELLIAIAKLRLATVDLLAAVLGASEQMVRRRSRSLTDKEFLKADIRSLSGIRGRPELVYGLGDAGVRWLKESSLVPSELPFEHCTGGSLMPMIEHQLRMNWVLHWSAKLPELYSPKILKSLSSSSPFDLEISGQSLVSDDVVFKNGKRVPFEPDAVIALTRPQCKKGLLFFLEIDGGTEPLTCSKMGKSDHSISKKLVVYRNYLIKRGYNRYAKPVFFGNSFHGFRLLFIAPNHARLKSICRLIRSTAPLGFVWCADWESIQNKGFWQTEWMVEGFMENRRKLL